MAQDTNLKSNKEWLVITSSKSLLVKTAIFIKYSDIHLFL